MDAVLVVDVEGRVTLSNTAAAQITGNRSRSCVVRHRDPARGRELGAHVVRRRIEEGDVLRREESWLVTKADVRVPVSVTGSPVLDPNGRLEGIVLVARDVRQLRQLLADKEAEIARPARPRMRSALRRPRSGAARRAAPQLLLAERRATLGTLAGGVVTSSATSRRSRSPRSRSSRPRSRGEDMTVLRRRSSADLHASASTSPSMASACRRASRGIDRDRARAIADRVDRVDHEVDEDLLDAGAVDRHGQRIAAELGHESTRRSLPAPRSIAITSLDDRVEIDRRDAIRAGPRELHQALAVLGDVLADALESGRIALRQRGDVFARGERGRAARRPRRPGSARCCAARDRHRPRACRASRGARRAAAACASARAAPRSRPSRRAARPRPSRRRTISASLSASSWRSSRTSRATSTMPCSAPCVEHRRAGDRDRESRSPVLVTSQDSSRRSTSPSSMRRRTTVRSPELSSTSRRRDRHARCSSSRE